MTIYSGDNNNHAQAVKKMYLGGIDNKCIQVKKAYVGDIANVAQQFFLSGFIVGNEPINRSAYVSVANATVISLDNPAVANGTVITIEIWAETSLENCEVATFYNVSGDNYTTRDSETIGSVTAGSRQVFTVSLNIETGDFIGIYATAGRLEGGGVTGSHHRTVAGDQIPCTNVNFSSGGSAIVSLKAIVLET